MKIIKEGYENLDKVVDSKEIDTVATVPVPMADAILSKEEKEPMFDVEKLKNEKPFLGARKQPTPKAIKEPKVHLEESMFETVMNEECNTDEECLEEKKEYTPEEEEIFWKLAKEKMSDDAYDDLCKSLGKDCKLEEDDEDDTNDLMGYYRRYNINDTHNKAYYDAKDVDKDDRKEVKELRRQEFNDIHHLDDFAGTEWDSEESRSDGDDEYTMYDVISDELYPSTSFSNLAKTGRTKFPDILQSDRYNPWNMGSDYDGNITIEIGRKDGDVDADEFFKFARLVAQEYDIKTKMSQKGDKITLYTSELFDVPAPKKPETRGRKRLEKGTEEEEVDEGLFNKQDRLLDTVDNIVNNVGPALNTAVSSNSVLNGENTATNLDAVGKLAGIAKL